MEGGLDTLSIMLASIRSAVFNSSAARPTRLSNLVSSLHNSFLLSTNSFCCSLSPVNWSVISRALRLLSSILLWTSPICASISPRFRRAVSSSVSVVPNAAFCAFWYAFIDAISCFRNESLSAFVRNFDARPCLANKAASLALASSKLRFSVASNTRCPDHSGMSSASRASFVLILVLICVSSSSSSSRFPPALVFAARKSAMAHSSSVRVRTKSVTSAWASCRERLRVCNECFASDIAFSRS